MKTLSKEQALHIASIFNDYFGQFDRIDKYMRDQKMAQIESLPVTLPGMGLIVICLTILLCHQKLWI